ncbi:hypothetical protein BC826DRAFT_1103652 [Russula brevipes]|nr:hypothetical protein BC826DRAFT_1103652 [Russula brevipes]
MSFQTVYPVLMGPPPQAGEAFEFDPMDDVEPFHLFAPPNGPIPEAIPGYGQVHVTPWFYWPQVVLPPGLPPYEVGIVKFPVIHTNVSQIQRYGPGEHFQSTEGYVSTTDTFKVPNEKDTTLSSQDVEIAPADPQKIECPPHCKHTTSGRPTYNASDVDSPMEPVRPSCEACSRSFGRAQELKRHNQAKHMSLRPCPFCPFRWSRPDKFKKHAMAQHKDSESAAELLKQIKDLEGRYLIKAVDDYCSNKQQMSQPLVSLGACSS